MVERTKEWPRAWRGSWIGRDAPAAVDGGEPQWHAGVGGPFARILFRKRFSLDTVPERAPLRITADSRYVLFVNGAELGRGPVRSQPRRLRYDEVDLAPALQPGDNTIVVLVTYYGAPNSFWQPSPFNEGLGRVAVLVAEADLGEGELLSDETWEAKAVPAWSAASRAGIDGVPVEILDARLLDPAWREGRGDGWLQAHVLPATHIGSLARATPPTDPYGALLPRPIGPLGDERMHPRSARITEETSERSGGGDHPVDHVLRLWPTLMGALEAADPAVITLQVSEGGTRGFEIDFGRVVAGLVEFAVDAPEGSVVDLLYREKPAARGDEAVFSTPRTGARYIARGRDDRFEALEVNGFRYVTALVTVPTGASVTVREFSVRERVYPIRGDAFFRSSDAELDALYAAGRRTVTLNALDSYIDCPTREQRAWVGDGVVHQSVHLTTSTDWRMPAWYVELGNSPRPDGILPMSVVGEIEHSGAATIADWSLYWIRGVLNLLRYAGDRRAVEAAAPTARRILEWYVPYLNEHGVVADVPEWNLVDWSSILLTGESGILTGLWARSLQDYAEIAEFLGNAGDAARARALHARAVEGFERFWDEARGTYVDHVLDGRRQAPASQLAGAVAIVSGLAPTGRWDRILRWIGDTERQVVRSWIGGDGGYDQQKILDQMRGLQRIDWDADRETVVAEPFAAHVVHDAYTAAGRPDLVVASMRRWSTFLVDYDTFGECWGWGTPVHGWSSTPTRDLVVSLLGVTPAAPGFAAARVAPAVGLVERFEGAAPTPAGLLRVSVEGSRVHVESPVPFVLVTPDGAEQEHPAGVVDVG